MQTCPRCGAENKDDQSACWNCWAPLGGSQAAPAAPSQEAPVRRGVPWKPIVVILAIVVVAFVAYTFLGGSSPVQVADTYLDAHYNGRTRLLPQVTAPDTATRPLLPALLLMDEYEVDKQQRPEIGDGRAEVAASVSFRISPDAIKSNPKLAGPALQAQQELKKPLLTRVILIKQTGKWKVDQAATSERFVQDGLGRLPDDKAWIGELLKGRPLKPIDAST